MNWYLKALKKYAEFSGRAQRKEYWMFLLFYILIYIAFAIIDGVTGTFSTKAGMGLLGGLYAIALLIPCIAVTVRRLHDTNRSGWWILIGLVPLIGNIILLVFMVQDSYPGENRYGPNPKDTV
ncbi:MAG: DUF805 domain-containing protein [Proteobacteria bacterium]|nr:DUF805 domain-containing protein [Pseudomonadota bacterium]